MPFKKMVGAFAIFAALFQIATIAVPVLGGDEGIFALGLEAWLQALSGHIPPLNPIIDYMGPIDAWLYGLPQLIAYALNHSPNAAWIRCVPVLLSLWGLWCLQKEIAQKNARAASYAVLWTLTLPLYFVYSRTAFGHSVMMGLFFFLLAESLRIVRTREVRWIRIALLGGLALECHTTALIGLAATFAPVLPLMFGALTLRKGPPRKAQAAGAIALFLILSYPVLRSFPPPVGTPHERAGSVLFEFRNLLSVLGGFQPLHFAFLKDPWPAPVLVALLGLMGALIVWRIRNLKGTESDLKRYWISHLAAGAFLAFFCYRGRSLTLIGHERYFLSLVPGFGFLFGEALALWAKRLPPRREPVLAMAVSVFFFLRLAIPVLSRISEEDPYLRAARWLEKECPRESCVASAEGFWVYWPVRYYTGNRLDLRSYGENWKFPHWPQSAMQPPRDASDQRDWASCWLAQSRAQFPAGSRTLSHISIPAGMGAGPIECFFIPSAQRRGG